MEQHRITVGIIFLTIEPKQKYKKIPRGTYEVFVTVLFMREEMNTFGRTFETYDVTMHIGTVFTKSSICIEQLALWTSGWYLVTINTDEKLVATSQARHCCIIFNISANVVVACLVTKIVVSHFFTSIY